MAKANDELDFRPGDGQNVLLAACDALDELFADDVKEPSSDCRSQSEVGKGLYEATPLRNFSWLSGAIVVPAEQAPFLVSGVKLRCAR